MAQMLATAATLRRGATIKFVFFLLAVADFLFTLLALRLGLVELNPLVSGLLQVPVSYFLFKVIISFFLAWLIPSRLLLPSMVLLSFVVGWNLKELIIFLG